LTLRIKPVMLKQSVYFRVPNDIADLIGIDSHADVTLSLEQGEDQYLLVYSVRKTPFLREPAQRTEPLPLVQRAN
jgi:hypothetical protein